MAARIPDSRQRKYEHGPLPRRTKNVTASLDPDLYQRLKQHTEKTKTPISLYLKQLIESDLNANTNPSTYPSTSIND